MKAHKVGDIRIVLPEAALASIFDECDRFDDDETGGRIVGTCKQDGEDLTMFVMGIIEAGPQARRSRVSLFQDGDYQEPIFRRIEEQNPDVEHLGTWHTHHVNGLQTLSGGDLETYHRTVNHRNHNLPFFYALLVTTKNRSKKALERYDIRHYVFRRGDDRVYEVPASLVTVVNSPLVWPMAADQTKAAASPQLAHLGSANDRIGDRDVLGEFFPGFRTFSSKSLGLYWRGEIELADNSKVEVVVVEDADSRPPKYSVTIRKPSPALESVLEELLARDFPSARLALIAAERSCNRALYQHGAKQ